MQINKIPVYVYSIGMVTLILLEIINPTLYEIRDTYAKLVNIEKDTNAFDLSCVIYLGIIPLVINSMIICVIGKYTHESARSMITCYISSIHMVIMSYISNFVLICAIDLFIISSYFLTNCVQILGTILLVLSNSIIILYSELVALKRINNIKSLRISLIHANKKTSSIFICYFILYSLYFAFMSYKVYVNLGMRQFLFSFVLSFFGVFFISCFMNKWYDKRTNV